MNEKEFRHWLEGSHNLLEIFWGGYGEYSLSSRWVDEWFDFGEFIVRPEDEEALLDLASEPDYQVLGTIVRDSLRQGKRNNVGFAFAPYLFVLNIARFNEYFRENRDFSLTVYFESLGKFVQLNQDKIRYFRDSDLLRDEINENTITIFEEVNKKLKEIGIGHNEPVGTARVLHILAPYYFPLIDNHIAEWVRLNIPKETLTYEDYREWMMLT